MTIVHAVTLFVTMPDVQSSEVNMDFMELSTSQAIVVLMNSSPLLLMMWQHDWHAIARSKGGLLAVTTHSVIPHLMGGRALVRLT